MAAHLADPDAQWVRNVRAAHGQATVRRRGSRQVHLEEIPTADRAVVIAEYLRRGRERSGDTAQAKQAAFNFGLKSDPTIEDIAAIVDHYPVFRINYHP